MIKLLRADLARMRGNKYFWFCVLGTMLANGLNVYIMLMNFAYVTWEGMMLGFSGISLFTSGAFAALFLGEEYSDGTIRNKLIIGATRTQIYFSNTITAIAGGLCILAAEKLVPLMTALFGGAGKLTMSTEDFALGIAIYVCAVIASCVLFAAFGTIIAKRSNSVLLALVLTIAAYVAAPMIKNKLIVPQTITVSVYNESKTEIVDEYEELNPDSVSGAARAVLETVYNTLSFGQLDQVQRDTEARPFLPLYSLGTSVAVGTAGTVLFRRKDLK